jgi:integrase
MPSGNFSFRAEIPESITGKRILRQFKSREEAEGYAELMVVQRKNNGLSAFNLNEDQRSDARRAVELLRAAGIDTTLTGVVQFYLKHARPAAGDITVDDLIEKYQDAKERKQLRPRSLVDIEHRLSVFARTFGSRLVKDIRADEIEQWLFDDKTRSNQTRRNFRTVLNGFFKYAATQKYLAENPIPAVTNPAVEMAEPEVLTVPQISALLHAALHERQLELLPYVALGAFCGVRSDELAKLDWRAVDLIAGHVTISPKIAKKRRIRVIDIPEAARAWLTAGGTHESGNIRPIGFDRRWDKLLSAADRFALDGKGKRMVSPKPNGLLPWPANALRHSAASYHFAKHSDAAKTCAMLGQKDDKVLFDHYRSLIKPAEAERFYALRPTAASGKVIPMPATAVG